MKVLVNLNKSMDLPKRSACLNAADQLRLTAQPSSFVQCGRRGARTPIGTASAYYLVVHGRPQASPGGGKPGKGKFIPS